MPTLKLSQYIKLGGIALGALGALRIVFAELEVFEVHWISLIVLGLGAVVWFAGAWEAKHESAISTATTTTVVPAVVVPASTVTSTGTSSTVTVTPSA